MQRALCTFIVAATLCGMAALSSLHSTTIPLMGVGGAAFTCPVIPAPTNIGTNAGTGATVAVTVGVGGVPTGALIVVLAYDTASGTPGGSVADSAGNTYAALVTLGASATSHSMFYAFNATALVNTNTITYTKQNAINGGTVSAMYATNVKTTDPKDTAVNVTASGSSTTPTATSGTPVTAGELFVYNVAFISTGTFTQDVGNGWASPPNNSLGTGIEMQGGSQTNAGTGTKTAAPTLGTSSAWLEIMSGFKPNC